MTLDELLEALQALRAQYPAAGCAPIFCPLRLETPTYERGMVYLGCELVNTRPNQFAGLDEHGEHAPTLIH